MVYAGWWVLGFRKARGEDWERLGRLPGEVKVDMYLDMSEACVRVCAGGIKSQNPDMSEEELIRKLRERIAWSKRWQKHQGGF